MKWQAIKSELWRAVWHHDLGYNMYFLWFNILTTVEFIPKVIKLSENDGNYIAYWGELIMNEWWLWSLTRFIYIYIVSSKTQLNIECV